MRRAAFVLAATLFLGHRVVAQDMPPDYQAVLDALGRQGDFKDQVLKVNIPRSDLKVAVAGVALPTPFGFGGWVAFSRGDHEMDVAMGDLVLTEDEVSPVMSALLENGIEVTALHNHFFWESPRIYYMHLHAHGKAEEIATKLAPALSRIGKTSASVSPAMGTPIEGELDTEALAQSIGHPGERNGAVYKITIGRPDLDVREMGAPINARMGLNTWATFYGSDADAAVAGDVAMLEPELTPVLKALRSSGLDIVAIHHHMSGTRPLVLFLHYWGRGPAQKLAKGVRAAVDLLGKAPGAADVPQPVVFVCEHGAAKSVVAAAHFNRIAKELGLPFRAVSRGTNPDPSVPDLVSEGLRADGAPIDVSFVPSLVSTVDTASAARVVTFDVELPMGIQSSSVTNWSRVPAVSDGYAAARADIVRRVEALLRELEASREK